MSLKEFFEHIVTLTITPSTIATVAIFILIGLSMMTVFVWHKAQKLDFSDLITYPGNNKVSLTKFIQLVGGMVASWVVIKLAIQGTMTWDIFTAYLMYVGGVESYSKYLRSKYGPADKANNGNKPTKDGSADKDESGV